MLDQNVMEGYCDGVVGSGDGVETQNTLRCALEERWTAPAGRPATPTRARKKSRGIHTGTPTEQNAPNGSRAHAAVLERCGCSRGRGAWACSWPTPTMRGGGRSFLFGRLPASWLQEVQGHDSSHRQHSGERRAVAIGRLLRQRRALRGRRRVHLRRRRRRRSLGDVPLGGPEVAVQHQLRLLSHLEEWRVRRLRYKPFRHRRPRRRRRLRRREALGHVPGRGRLLGRREQRGRPPPPPCDRGGTLHLERRSLGGDRVRRRRRRRRLRHPHRGTGRRDALPGCAVRAAALVAAAGLTRRLGAAAPHPRLARRAAAPGGRRRFHLRALQRAAAPPSRTARRRPDRGGGARLGRSKPHLEPLPPRAGPAVALRRRRPRPPLFRPPHHLLPARARAALRRRPHRRRHTAAGRRSRRPRHRTPHRRSLSALGLGA
mmetsp:Transcript_342/g.1201  ORF Transcript_342/g.1201 Transcript_342/m.1201 type:complete len:431 (+) Transcript_342:56-1348(+)